VPSLARDSTCQNRRAPGCTRASASGGTVNSGRSSHSPRVTTVIRSSRTRTKYWAPAPPRLSDAGPPRGAQPGAPRSLVEEGATLAREGCVLRWTDAGQGVQYFVRVLDEQLAVVARGEWLERPEFAVPAAALARVEPGGRLFWQVDARAGDGTRRTSPLYSFRVR
jgi:hypothetical protein